MPAHTFTRVGYWQESIDTNIASAEAASPRRHVRRGAARDGLSGVHVPPDRAGRRRPARGRSRRRGVLAPARSQRHGAAPRRAAGLYAARRHPRPLRDRAGRLETTPRRSRRRHDGAMGRCPHALRSRARGRAGATRRGAAPTSPSSERAGRPAHGRAGRRLGRRQVGNPAADCSGVDDLRGGTGEPRASRCSPRRVDAADATDKPAPSRPARSRPLVSCWVRCCRRPIGPRTRRGEFEATLKKEPNRFRAVAGAMRAAEAAGDSEAAARHARELLEIAKTADSDRPELARARQVAGKT